MAEKQTSSVTCSFCGAPYKKPVPPEVFQLRCEYCGSTFVVRPRVGVEVAQCRNHPVRYAVGKCNKCGEKFCSACLGEHVLPVAGENQMRLYLCPQCAKRPSVSLPNVMEVVGVFVLIVGFFFATFSLLLGAGLIVTGAVEAFIGFRSKDEKETNVRDEPDLGWEDVKDEELLKGKKSSADTAYDYLLERYVEALGVPQGPQRLDSEIKSLIRSGKSFAEATQQVLVEYQNRRRS